MRAFLFLCFLVFAGLAQAGELRVEPLKIITAKGAYAFKAEIAATEAERAEGLMFRKHMAPDHAMLFDFGSSRTVYFWMKNTDLSLDMIFVKSDGTVASIAANAVPQSLDAISSGEPVLACIEVLAGTAARLGIAKGDKVKHRIFHNAG